MVGTYWCAWFVARRASVLILASIVFLMGCAVERMVAGGRPEDKFGGLSRPEEGQPIEMTPASVAFTNVPVGENYSQTVRFCNLNPTSLTISKITTTNAQFQVSGLILPALFGAGTCGTFTVSYQPSGAEDVRGRIQVSTSLREPALLLEVHGYAVQNEMALATSDAALNFEDIAAGSRSTKELSLTNPGNTSVTISKVEVSGDDFSVSGAGAVTLAPGQKISLPVSFDAKDPGNRSGTLAVYSNAPDSPLQIPLTGTSSVASQQSIALKWAANEKEASGYFVYRSSQAGGPYTKLQDAALPSAKFTDTGLAAGHTYYYVVTSVDANSVESEYSDQIAVDVP